MNAENKITVLLVDDSISFHSMIEMFLRQSAIKKYNLLSTTSAEDMFSLMEGTPDIDVILLDISLPGENGIAACRRLKAQNPSLPVIIITAKLDKQLMQTATEAGAADFLLKPFDGASLRSRITHAITPAVTLGA